MSQKLKRQYESSPLHGANAPYVEGLYETYLEDPARVAPGWRQFFGGLANGGDRDIARQEPRQCDLSCGGSDLSGDFAYDIGQPAVSGDGFLGKPRI